MLYSTQTGLAQEVPERNHLVQVGYGALSLQEIGVRIGNSSTLFFPVRKRVKQVVGPVQVSYSKALNTKWSIGAIASYTLIRSIREDIEENQSGETQFIKSGEDQSRFYTFMPTIQINWNKPALVQVYSGVSLGVLIVDYKGWGNLGEETRHTTKAAFLGHLNLLGIRIGKRVGGYVEGGIGTHGLATGGLYYSF
ncbi:hypothetical protein [Rufibacter tibetensis]|nr:hypothetical protein [Rufibacter tibetensis]